MGAHFITNPGEPNQLRIGVESQHLFWHSLWDPSLIRNDIGMVFLPQPVQNSVAIRPAILPSGADSVNQFEGELAVVSGWGVWSDAVGSASDVLRYVYDDVLTHTACAIRFPG